MKTLWFDQLLCFLSNLTPEMQFEWHFTIRGPPDSAFAGGMYHGRVLLPSNYPLAPPDIVFLTPSGRFEVGKRICLSITSYHTKTWQPSWTIRTVLIALIAFLPTPGVGAIGSLETSDDHRKSLAASSCQWECPQCKKTNAEILEATASVSVSSQSGPSDAPQLSFGYAPNAVTSSVSEDLASVEPSSLKDEVVLAPTTSIESIAETCIESISSPTPPAVPTVDTEQKASSSSTLSIDSSATPTQSASNTATVRTTPVTGGVKLNGLSVMILIVFAAICMILLRKILRRCSELLQHS